MFHSVSLLSQALESCALPSVLFYYVRRSVLFKIHAANIEASKFFCFVFVGDHGKLFLKIQVVCICYCYTFIFISQSVE